MDAINEHETGDLWVFGYGSLMWRPGFEVLERVPARLIGLHRALCVFSYVHRGTPEKPGLVLGLDRGHVQYAGRLSVAESLHFVRQGHGRSGNNRDYVLETVRSIEAQGFRDTQLHQLALMLHDEAPLHR